MNRLASVTVYDPDGLNPYGREVAALLAHAGHTVRLLAPADAEWIPLGVDAALILPATGLRSRSVKSLQLVRGLFRLMADAVRGRTILVCWSWYLVEKLTVALSGVVGRRLILVVHNPEGRGRTSRWTRYAERLERKTARVLVTHSAVLAADLPSSKLRVCVHPPYSSYLREFPRNRALQTEKDSGTTLLSLGAIRQDKGLDLLAEILGRLAPDKRRRLRLRFIGRDRDRGREVVDRTAPLIPVVNELREWGASDHDVVCALLESDALLAFYPGATQSGSAILALTAGIRVLGFDVGALHEIIRPEFLVPVGDLGAAAKLIEDLVTDRLPPAANALDLEAWQARAQDEWSAALQYAARRR